LQNAKKEKNRQYSRGGYLGIIRKDEGKDHKRTIIELVGVTSICSQEDTTDTSSALLAKGLYSRKLMKVAAPLRSCATESPTKGGGSLVGKGECIGRTKLALGGCVTAQENVTGGSREGGRGADKSGKKIKRQLKKKTASLVTELNQS